MPQLFLAIRCPECTTFQVDLLKTKPRFTCKICRAERSTDGVVFGSGSAPDCRKLTQKLSMDQATGTLLPPPLDASAYAERVNAARESQQKVQEARRELNLERQMRKLNQLRREKEHGAGGDAAGSASGRRALGKSKSASTGSFGKPAAAVKPPSEVPEHLKSSGSIVRPTLANAPLLAQRAQAEEEAKAATSLLAGIEWDEDDFAFQEELDEDFQSCAPAVVSDPPKPARPIARTVSAPQAHSQAATRDYRANDSTLPASRSVSAQVVPRTIPPVKQPPPTGPLAIELPSSNGHRPRDPSATPSALALSAAPAFAPATTLTSTLDTVPKSAPNPSASGQSRAPPIPKSIVVDHTLHALPGSIGRPLLPGIQPGIDGTGLNGGIAGIAGRARAGGEGLFTFFGKKGIQRSK